MGEEQQTEFEIEAYKEIGANYRYFLTWRHRLFAGYLAVVAALAIGFTWLYKAADGLLWVVFAAWFGLTAVFWALEGRNREGYRNCIDAGKACEGRVMPGKLAMYGELSRIQTSGHVRHSRTIDCFMFVSMVIAAAGFVWSLCQNAHHYV